MTGVGNFFSNPFPQFDPTLVLEEEGVVKIPAPLSVEEGATLPCAALTAWHALVEHGKVIAGQTVLLQGTGGVSVFGLQLAHAMGLQVVITSSSDEKLERAVNLGANKGINYKSTPNEHFTSSILCYLNGGDRA